MKYWIIAILSLMPSLYSHHGEDRGRGLRHTPSEVMEHVENHWHHVVNAKHNKISLQRLAHDLGVEDPSSLGIEAASHTDEVAVVVGKQNAQAAEAVASTPLPTSVDNSQLPSFPPIGDQHQLGSCVAFGSTYYQGTHEYGLLNGINNKNGYATIFSPKWTYNLCNGGADDGLQIFETYQLFAQSGYASWANFPYDTNYLAWDLQAQDWVGAINTRTGTAQLVSGIGGASQNLQVIKQLLSNGHVLTFGTFVDSWVFDYVKADPNAASNPHAGELAAVYMNGENGGHCMTIVGYNDSVWIDVNENGVVDAGEKGAFLIANSWGSGWGNHGFVWVSYDAFLNQSAVVNGPSAGRVALGAAMNSYVISVVPLTSHYAPKLVAQFTLAQTVRDQISVTVGISDTTTTTPTHTIASYALTRQGGNYEFNGANPGVSETATFALDLTDLLPLVASANQRFYLIVGDDRSGNPTTLQSFTLIDNVHSKQVQGTQAPQSFDNKQVAVYIDYNFTQPTPPPPAPTPVPPPPAPTPPPAPVAPTVSITYPRNNQSVMGYVWVMANASDPSGIDHVQFYIDGVLKATDRFAPYYFLFNSHTLSKGSHQIKAVAYNKHGASASQTITIDVIH